MKLYRLQKGNHKLPTETHGIFNLPRGISCPGKTKLCTAKCYAKKADQCYPQVPNFRWLNYRLSKCIEFVSLMKEELKNRKSIKVVRPHESGDFFSQEYLEKWFDIAAEFPDKIFYAYTKSFHLDFDKKPENFIIYASIDKTTLPNNLKIAERWINKGIFAGWAMMGSVKNEPTPTGFFECQKSCKICDYCYNKDKTGDIFLPLH